MVFVIYLFMDDFNLAKGVVNSLDAGRVQVVGIRSVPLKETYVDLIEHNLLPLYQPHMSNSLNSLKGGYTGDYIGDYYLGS